MARLDFKFSPEVYEAFEQAEAAVRARRNKHGLDWLRAEYRSAYLMTQAWRLRWTEIEQHQLTTLTRRLRFQAWFIDHLGLHAAACVALVSLLAKDAWKVMLPYLAVVTVIGIIFFAGFAVGHFSR